MSSLRDRSLPRNQDYRDLPADDHLNYGSGRDEDGVFESYDRKAERIAAESQAQIARLHPDHEATLKAMLDEEQQGHPLAAATGIATAAVIAAGIWIGVAIGYFAFF